MRKLSAHWVPRLLTLDQKRVRMNISNVRLTQGWLRSNKSEFGHGLISVDENWIHYYTPETKITVQTVDCKGGTGLKKSKNCFSFWESNDDCFGDGHEVILIDYLQKRKTITGAHATHHYFISRKEGLAGKRPHLQEKKPCFTKTAHRLTSQLLPWRKSPNYGLNCLTICLTQQI
ncbi:histone-lysine N-methyltransferase SETMAR [Trichonephila clavipes]|nr:histone-lysine N-methyltransferase SETMAR [Trichonephila clavipes]